MKLLRIEGLPEAPLEAAAAFHARWLEQARDCAEDVLLVFPPADHTHRQWRLGATQELAREAVPRRVNAVASDNEEAIAEAREYLADAPGITGQYLPLEKLSALFDRDQGAVPAARARLFPKGRKQP